MRELIGIKPPVGLEDAVYNVAMAGIDWGNAHESITLHGKYMVYMLSLIHI